MAKKVLSKKEFERLRQEWILLDNKYDNRIQKFLNNPGLRSKDELLKLKKMQDRLFDLEVEVLKVAKGKFSIE